MIRPVEIGGMSVKVSPGDLILILGPMFSEKTTNLIRAANGGPVFFPRRQAVEGHGCQTHDGDAVPNALTLSRPKEILDALENEPEWCGLKIIPIDEAALWTHPRELLAVIDGLMYDGCAVITCSFERDVNHIEPPIITHLKARARKILHIKAFCAVCGKLADNTQKLSGSSVESIEPGAKFEPRCDEHFTPIWKKVPYRELLDDDGDRHQG